MISPRLHQLSPTSALKPMAMQHARDHGVDPADAGGERGVQGDLDDEQRGQRRGQRRGLAAQLEGDDIADHGGDGRPHRLDDHGLPAPPAPGSAGGR